ncbi:MAG: T9SS type B sorting domain-containing protein [Paludibacteraceae bacterium]|nr:T9SS type B sorting domain-containing protein [Paludibacteraceae bacterium]
MKPVKLICFITLFLSAVTAFGAENGTVLFKEDFGGNSLNDPPYGSPPLPDGVIEGLLYSSHLWDMKKNGYSIRKEAIKRATYQGNHTYNGWYAEFGDHTHEGDLTRGNFLQIDLDYKEATFYNVKVDDLCENTDLTFSFWGHPVNASVNAPVTLTIEDENGNVLNSETFYINCKAYKWQYFSMPFTVPVGQTSIVYRVYSGAGGNGGDFALDDIEILLNTPPVEVNMPDDSLCVGSNFTIKAKFDNTNSSYIEPVTYTWYKNTTKDYTKNWEKVGKGPTLSFENLSEAEAGYYKVQVSSAGVESNFSLCESASDIVPILVKRCNIDTTLYDTICYGETYEFAGQTLSETGIYTDTLVNHLGGDSVISLELTVLDEILPTVLKKSICEGESYTYESSSLTKAGEYEFKFTSEAGCDSIVILSLDVVDAVTKDIEETICEGTAYKFGTQVLTTSGIYKETFTSAAGCDSIVTLTLKVADVVTKTIEETICEGTAYKFGSQVLTTPGTYKETFTSVAGCDSIVTLTLKVAEVRYKDVEETICEGTAYKFGTQVLTTPGTYKETFTSVAGCDSIVTLTLKVAEVSYKDIEETICEGSAYKFGTQVLTTPGVYKETFTNTAGCDSIVTLTLKVAEVSYKDIEETICEGTAYKLGTQVLTTSGIYKETFTNAAGCDSIVTLTLKVAEVSYKDIEETICEGIAYKFGTQVLTTSGIYKETFTNAAGCDSIVTLTLKVAEVSYKDIEETICEGTNYKFGTQTLSSSGIYKETFTSVDGCDSIVTLTLKVADVYNKTIEEFICEGDSYKFGTQTLTTSGTYKENFTSVDGCDSIVTLTLKVGEISRVAVKEAICEGQSFVFGTQTLTSTGEYVETFTNVAGCDSIVTLTLNVAKNSATAIEETICEGESYTLGEKTYSTAGTYEETFTNVAGCDSVVTLTLKVAEVNKVAIEETICQGGSYTFGKKTYATAGTYVETFTNVAGCDSIVTLTLKVAPKSTNAIEETICEGESFVFGTQTLSSAGKYKETFTNAAGCDSVVTLTLKLAKISRTAIKETICEGQTFVFGTQTLNTAGEYVETFTNVAGCDSIVTLTLNVAKHSTNAIEETICEGESYKFGSKTYNAAGTYEEVFTNAAGCDSIVTLTLKMAKIDYVTVEETICEGDYYRFGKKRLNAAGEYVETFKNILGCDSVVTLVLKVTDKVYSNIEETICRGDVYVFGDRTLKNPGQYKATFTSSTGCDSIVTLDLKVTESSKSTIREMICEGETYEFGSQTLTETGKYEETYVSANGCDSVVTLYLTVVKPHIVEFNDTIKEGAIYKRNGFYIDSYEVGENVFTHEGVNRYGCDSIVTLNLFVIEKVVRPDVIPAKFMTPNGDGIRDTWEIENLSYYSKYTVKIFNRWGKLLVTYTNEYPGWDGYYLGHPQPSTDYWFEIDLEETDTQKVGSFTLLR